MKHLNRLKDLVSVQNKFKNIIIYTDKSKLDTNLDAELCFMYKDITYQQFWNLEINMKVYDAELFSIHQALKLKLKEITKHQKSKDIWIFSDNQAVIQRIQQISQESGQQLVIKCQNNLQSLMNNEITSHIHWISEYKNIKDNKIADETAKLNTKQSNSSDTERFISISYVKHRIKVKALKNWITHWKKTTQERYYSQFDQTSSFYIKEDLKLVNRLLFTTFI